MADEKEIQKVEKKVLSVSLRIAKKKQEIVQECFKILKIAAVKTEQKFDEEKIADKIYNAAKKIDNEKITKLFKLKGKRKKESENKIIKKIVNSFA